MYGRLDSHRLGTVLFPCNTCCRWDQLNTLNPSYINDTFVAPPHFSIHLNKFSHPGDGTSVFYRNFGTFNHNHNVVQTPNRSLSLHQHIRTYFYKIKKKMVALIILIIALQFDVSTSCNDSLRWRHPGILPSQLRSHLFPVAMAKLRPCCCMVTMVTRDDSLWWRKSVLRAPADVTFSLAGYPI